ncbi:MAG TPA: cardiolipin synthase [Microlunatus sp.]|nr:cardiolipin synthase [Microlunatus sp.]
MLADLVPWLLLILNIILVIIVGAYVASNRNPSSAIAWILMFVFLPVVGILFFLLVGSPKLPKSRKEKQREVNRLILERTEGLHLVSREGEWPDYLASMVRMNRELGALPMVGGNHATLNGDYVGSFDSMIADIDRAQKWVHVEFFILVLDTVTQPFFDALARACQRGVKVRVLSDHIAQIGYPNRKKAIQTFADMGAEYVQMLPIKPFKGQWRRPDLRNHRKIVIVDGEVAHTGSQNLTDRSYNKKKNIERGLQWQELMMRVTGPAVRELEAVFASDWYADTGELPAVSTVNIELHEDPTALDMQVLPSGPTFDNDNNAKLFAGLIHSAKWRVSVTSPYYVPDEPIQRALVVAASRGLDVELFVSEVSDQFMVYHAQRSYYEELLRAGVRIYMYPPPYILHAKHLSFDDDVAVIGTSNLDIRSLSLHMELMVLVEGTEFVDDMRRVEDDYRAKSKEILLEDWLKRPRREKLFDNLMRLTSSLQ